MLQLFSRCWLTLRIGVLELLDQGLALTLGQRLDESKGLEKIRVSACSTIELDRV